jgi:hypothetical protein
MEACSSLLHEKRQVDTDGVVHRFRQFEERLTSGMAMRAATREG